MLDRGDERQRHRLPGFVARLRTRGGVCDVVAGPAREREVVTRFTDAYERGDIDAMVALLTDDATLTMPPLPFVYQGGVATGNFLAEICAIHRFRLVPTRANGQPAFGVTCVTPPRRSPEPTG